MWTRLSHWRRVNRFSPLKYSPGRRWTKRITKPGRERKISRVPRMPSPSMGTHSTGTATEMAMPKVSRMA